MGIISKSLNRSKTGDVRKEDDRTNMIKDFFADQKEVVRYEIADSKEWLVNVEGAIHLHDDDLDNGVLFFKIGKLTGNLYCHCKHIKQSVVPVELGGEIVFVPDEEELWENRSSQTADEDGFRGMEMLSTKPSVSKMRKRLANVLSDYVEYEFDIDLDEIIRELESEKADRESYQLEMEIKPNKKGRGLNVNFFVATKGDRIQLKLSAIEKTFYMMFILKKDGIIIEDIIPKLFLKDARAIYSQLGDRAQDDHNGLMADDYVFSTDTLRTYFTEIRNALKEVIKNKHTIEQFAIEGYSGKEFKVEKATDEIRDHIRNEFGV